MASGLSGKVALTFDDGPDPVWTAQVLDALGEVGARATFFVVAPSARRYPGLPRRAGEEGHEVALHCTRHRRHDGLTRGGILTDADEGLRTLRNLGHETRRWRTPWGLVTPDTEAVAEELGLRLVGWSADSEDWRGDGAGGMLRRVEPGLRPDAVVLLHDGLGPGAGRDGCAETVRLIGPLVSAIRSRGLKPVVLGELDGPLPDRNPNGFAAV